MIGPPGPAAAWLCMQMQCSGHHAERFRFPVGHRENADAELEIRWWYEGIAASTHVD